MSRSSFRLSKEIENVSMSGNSFDAEQQSVVAR